MGAVPPVRAADTSTQVTSFGPDRSTINGDVGSGGENGFRDFAFRDYSRRNTAADACRKVAAFRRQGILSDEPIVKLLLLMVGNDQRTAIVNLFNTSVVGAARQLVVAIHLNRNIAGRGNSGNCIFDHDCQIVENDLQERLIFIRAFLIFLVPNVYTAPRLDFAFYKIAAVGNHIGFGTFL